MSGQSERREEFAAFLRTRRERLQPADVGLQAGSRRRVAGLRREEVAQLAGVGLTWYTWLEQGRPIAASDQVLNAIARALRMSEDERDHLFALAGVAPPGRDERACVEPAHLDLLAKLMPYPAAVQTARFDIRAYNRSYRFLFDDFDAYPADERNCAVRIFTDPVWQRAHLDLDHAQHRIASRLRAAYGRHHDEPGWQQFVGRLERDSPVFADLWRRGDVGGEQSTRKNLLHPEFGPLHLEMTSLWIGESGASRVVWFSPVDEATERAVERLSRVAPGDPVVSTPSSAIPEPADGRRALGATA
ncbi:helix-turn-helix transcriptional regulator [Microbacterium dextranolyticum]|uniref:DNA-binding protein n=1 Tax=Microbacterium dextranolyticum TaxID=36806 RepID=A0A9W6HLL4_9MICO|nr:helix-turn-helix transcriptional regulator [Microbacterium dextranolyticum]MBM7463372.1 transcriptional regulator with XRE-family HTH domain [Microbacterium dextranolyticum]GLJ95525.1 DNA-binding protein [Microbacterium dextranolyticum]